MGFDTRKSIEIELNEANKQLKRLQNIRVKDSATLKLIKEQEEYISCIKENLKED